MKWVSLLMLVAQTVSVVFAMRLSRTRVEEGPRYLNTTAVFFSEVMKLCCSFLFLWHEQGDVGSAAKTVKTTFSRSGVELLKVSVPSLLYTVQNNLLFISLSNLSGAVYQVTYQLKILTTAVLSVIILGKALGTTKWCSLLILTSGVALIQMPRGDVQATPKQGNTMVGLVAVLSACITSGLAGVYLEKILKQTDSSIWMRNIQLAFFGGILAFLGCFMQDGQQIQQNGFMQGYSSLVWAVIALQAVGGLVVAAVLKYADNILKCFGNAMSIVISCLLSSVLLKEFEPDMHFVLGTILVIVATTLYSIGVPQSIMRLLSNDKEKVEEARAASESLNAAQST
eukprot:CAMPEP_0181487050 /NCGR_PEP_ID=MMETSP1110-20121109/47590_1 /TAXON_ID=174948 /ORGANISM="Symbiodinium sp., Strain CCMP421" /LENGTH=340 /DNA_ID=CAMNT_0023613487 /DNA_START=20 /DNA_END=1042 /DNA_ORIENTATION=-